MSKFIKKPVEIEAIQWTGENIDELLAFANTGSMPLWGRNFQINKMKKEVQINTLEGEMIGRINNWIIRGVKGEFYPCKPDIFDETYESIV